MVAESRQVWPDDTWPPRTWDELVVDRPWLGRAAKVMVWRRAILMASVILETNVTIVQHVVALQASGYVFVFLFFRAINPVVARQRCYSIPAKLK